jgi:hypothetical protein
MDLKDQNRSLLRDAPYGQSLASGRAFLSRLLSTQNLRRMAAPQEISGLFGKSTQRLGIVLTSRGHLLGNDDRVAKLHWS